MKGAQYAGLPLSEFTDTIKKQQKVILTKEKLPVNAKNRSVKARKSSNIYAGCWMIMTMQEAEETR